MTCCRNRHCRALAPLVLGQRKVRYRRQRPLIRPNSHLANYGALSRGHSNPEGPNTRIYIRILSNRGLQLYRKE